MQGKGIIRFSAAAVLCITVLLYNTFDYINIFLPSGKNTDNPSLIFFDDTLRETEEKEETIKEENTQQTTQNTEQTSSQEVSSEKAVETLTGAVKGKIISGYVSPYTAPISYNKVYMKNSTSASVDIKSMLEGKIGFSIEENSQPQVLIMHTHTTETYMLSDTEYYTEDYTSRTTDNSKNMVKVGEKVTEILNAAGIKTLHAKEQHDYPKYNGSYTRSAATVKEYLEKYPSIKIVLDLHRDAITSGESDKKKLVTEIEGKKAAQVMLVMGSQTGSVTNHPNWQENLKLAVKLQQTMEKKYPTLARPISLVSSKYNQNLTTGSLLIEFGTDANTLDEAVYSAQLVGNALTELLKGL